MNRSIARMLIASATLVASASVSAQGAMAPSLPDRPKAVGVSQGTADDVNRKAVQDGSTATVVRTGPSAADKARDVASSTKRAVKKKTNAADAKTPTGADGTTTTATKKN